MAALEGAGDSDAETLQLLAGKVQDLECLRGVDPAEILRKVTASLEDIRKTRYTLQLVSRVYACCLACQLASRLAVWQTNLLSDWPHLLLGRLVDCHRLPQCSG